MLSPLSEYWRGHVPLIPRNRRPCPVASFGLVSPGTATICIDFTRVSPPWMVSPHTFFLPVRPRLSTILCKFAHKNFFPSGVTPEGCQTGRSALPPPSPSDATVRATGNFLKFCRKFRGIYNSIVFLKFLWLIMTFLVFNLTHYVHNCTIYVYHLPSPIWFYQSSAISEFRLPI